MPGDALFNAREHIDVVARPTGNPDPGQRGWTETTPSLTELARGGKRCGADQRVSRHDRIGRDGVSSTSPATVSSSGTERVTHLSVGTLSNPHLTRVEAAVTTPTRAPPGVQQAA